ncbi:MULTISPECIES: cation diffusion facilitator family transporter [unclassified Novosphingobium]|uniref:cation diffusion facilitator family transporter n=1 Tax=unclassified Novosphingobium TaxID=2644732 RepID=UPI00086E28B7|nr:MULTISPECIES: cation diffusion facilitator family transporter [unclassified Novosphingobium]MBN9142790.1 cation diffusion facilitator family transporter [Novosphingobium sp.]MDR6705875.1 ferrous-iron efflux pump FieF [Novosphingobium sp. 1748]ODU85043.1 MAG: divalent metal cation transporter FieF [Novosphingobium sp. SCN 63-17]OJX89180.1 MAG: divalent metal cation transporter FieF [Novosphingobium sp. 63-713]
MAQHNHSAPDHSALNRSAAYASISMALLLVGLKGWAAWTTGSTAMLGSLADTLLDLVASLATLAGVWVAGMPADDNHRFGHGKAEALSAMFQVLLIGASALALAVHSVQQLMSGERTGSAGDGILVSVIAIIGTLALLAWQQYVLRRTRSVAIFTDHLHYKSDLLLNMAVIVALLLDQYAGLTKADPLFGLGIALWLGWGAYHASEEAIEQLMDREWPEDKKARFVEVLGRHPELRGVHDLRTRTSGNRDFVQFHVWVDGNMTVTQAHRVMDEIEDKLREEFPEVEILIHPDPEGHVDERGVAGRDILQDV